jgi:DNA-binding NarL/FixJ family response regulator
MVSMTRSGAVGTENALPPGLICFEGQERVDTSKLEQVSRVAARINKGRKAPSRETPALAVIWCPAAEGDLSADEVSDIRGLASDAPVLVFVSTPNLCLARAALQAGASGLLYSSMSEEQIIRAISMAISGEVVLPRELLVYWREERRPPDLSVLSARKREILQLLIEGLSNAEIARQVWLSESAVKQNLRAIYKVLGVRNRIEVRQLPWLRAHVR